MKFINDLRSVMSRLPSPEMVGDINMAIPLRDLIYSRAYFSSFISQIARETTDSFPLTNYHVESFLVFFLFWTCMTIMNRPNEGVVSRLGHVIEYKQVRKNVSRILFVCYILFVKNLDNAI